jgi:hypothetical protein
LGLAHRSDNLQPHPLPSYNTENKECAAQLPGAASCSEATKNHQEGKMQRMYQQCDSLFGNSSFCLSDIDQDTDFCISFTLFTPIYHHSLLISYYSMPLEI